MELSLLSNKQAKCLHFYIPQILAPYEEKKKKKIISHRAKIEFIPCGGTGHIVLINDCMAHMKKV